MTQEEIAEEIHMRIEYSMPRRELIFMNDEEYSNFIYSLCLTSLTIHEKILVPHNPRGNFISDLRQKFLNSYRKHAKTK